MLKVLIFSPTGNSSQVAKVVANELGGDPLIVDLTKTHQVRELFDSNDTVVIAGPVFGGRMPSLMLERMKFFSFNAARAITLVTYGNRAYEDALLELNDTVIGLGGIPVASAALVARHSMVPTIAQDRPTAIDLNNLKAFARLAKKKLQDDRPSGVHVPGNYPYRSWSKSPLTPVIDGNCLKCGNCVRNCPAAAISAEDPTVIDVQKCILCMRCVVQCPQHARVLPDQVSRMITKKLEPVAHLKREDEFFI